MDSTMPVQVNIPEGQKNAIFLIGILQVALGVSAIALTTAVIACMNEYVDECYNDGDSDYQCRPLIWAWRMLFTAIGIITGISVSVSGGLSIAFARHPRRRMGCVFSALAASSVVLVCCSLGYECFLVVGGYDDFKYESDLLDAINAIHDVLLSFYVALMSLTISNIVLFTSGGYCDCCCGSQSAAQSVGQSPNVIVYYTSTQPEESQHTKEPNTYFQGYSGPMTGTGESKCRLRLDANMHNSISFPHDPQHQHFDASSSDQHAQGPGHWHGAYMPQPNAELPRPPSYAPTHQYPDEKRIPD